MKILYRFDSLKHLIASIRVFTEQVLYMLATILKGNIITKMVIKLLILLLNKDMSIKLLEYWC